MQKLFFNRPKGPPTTRRKRFEINNFAYVARHLATEGDNVVNLRECQVKSGTSRMVGAPLPPKVNVS